MAEFTPEYLEKQRIVAENRYEALVKKTTNHVVSRLITWYLAFTVFGFLFTLLMDAFQFGWGHTDGVSTRSNMEIRVDYGTGCEYLVDERGGLTPRLSPEGEHMCGTVENL